MFNFLNHLIPRICSDEIADIAAHARAIVASSSSIEDVPEKYSKVAEALSLNGEAEEMLSQFTSKESIHKFGLKEVIRFTSKP